MKRGSKQYIMQEQSENETSGMVGFDAENSEPNRKWGFIDNKISGLRNIYGDYTLQDPYFKSCYDSVHEEDGKLFIATAWRGYRYRITLHENAGSGVEFFGPVNALLNQNLLPEMIYIPYTLEWKFTDWNTGEAFPDYMAILRYFQ